MDKIFQALNKWQQCFGRTTRLVLYTDRSGRIEVTGEARGTRYEYTPVFSFERVEEFEQADPHSVVAVLDMLAE